MLRRIISFFSCKKKEDLDGILYAFDFDQTILNLDSEVAISSILKSKVPPKIIQFYTGGNWAAYCQMLFDHVILTDGIPLDDILQSVRRLELVPGMHQLLNKVQLAAEKNSNSRFIIITGSNDLFVETVLTNLDPQIKPSTLISNFAHRIDIPGQLSRVEFEAHDDQHDCHMCPKNLCKGAALLKFIEDNGPFGIIYYTGDGPNDVCPGLKLRSTDILFVRRKHALETIIAHGFFVQTQLDFKAQIIYFETGEDIENIMKL